MLVYMNVNIMTSTVGQGQGEAGEDEVSSVSERRRGLQQRTQTQALLQSSTSRHRPVNGLRAAGAGTLARLHTVMKQVCPSVCSSFFWMRATFLLGIRRGGGGGNVPCTDAIFHFVRRSVGVLCTYVVSYVVYVL